MKFAVIVVDMHKDAVIGSRVNGYRAIVPRVGFLIKEARKLGGVIVFALDSFLAEDFLFEGQLQPFAIQGTKGAELIDDFDVYPEDIVLPKRRFSAFFKTNLDITLKDAGVDTVAVTGINTDICVFSTVIDAFSNDFYTVVISDCTAARSPEIHETILSNLSGFGGYPMLRVRTADEFLIEVKEGRILDAT